MTDAMPDPKSRSSFMPIMLLVVGLVVVAGVVVACVPMVECNVCWGVLRLTVYEVVSLDPVHVRAALEDLPREYWVCRWCSGEGKVNAITRLFKEPSPSIMPTFPTHRGDVIDREHAKVILKARQSTP